MHTHTHIHTVDEDFLEVDDIVFIEGGPRVMCVAITILNDEVAENCAEMFGATITSGDERVNNPTDMVIVQIDDDDGERIELVNPFTRTTLE